MTLIDTGPLISLVYRRDTNRQRCLDAVKRLHRGPLLTTWPCLAEAMYLLGKRAGHAGQSSLWTWWTGGRLVIHASSDEEIDRMAELMDRYRDLPMDLADASLVAAAERLGLRTVFTLDGDFRVYRLADGSALDLIPAEAE